MKTFNLRRICGACFGALFAACAARAYVLLDLPPWPDGTVTLQIELGSQLIYSDESTPNSNALVAQLNWSIQII